MRSPHALQLITDSLRYWVTEMHVDGFRFDLAATLARQFQDVDKLSAFFDIVEQDPIISRVKLIAEPWDLGSAAIRWAASRPAGPNGMPLPRHRARLLALAALHVARIRLALDGAAPTCIRSTAVDRWRP